jgi:LysM repeat protein
MDQRTRRSPARFLAPLALIAVLVVLFAIVSGGGSTNSSSPDQTSSSQTTTTTKTTATKKKSSSAKKKAAATGGSKTYTVQVGDTLGGIADKTGVPLDRIQELNPNVDATAMTSGQKIKLK